LAPRETGGAAPVEAILVNFQLLIDFPSTLPSVVFW